MATLDPRPTLDAMERELPAWRTVVPVTVALLLLAAVGAVGVLVLKDVAALGMWFVANG